MSPFAPSRHAASAGQRSGSTSASRRGVSRRNAFLLASAIALASSVLASVDARPAAGQSHYLLLSRSELQALPTSGRAWDYMVGVARSAWPDPELDDQDNKTNVEALAAALVYARTGDTSMRAKARHALVAMIPTYDLSKDGGLGPARQIAGWVLVADFIRLGGSEDDAFRALLRRALTHPIGTHPRWGGSLAACQEDSDNNWGAWCSASRIAAALYLGDMTELARADRVFRGFLGDRSAWSHFRGQGSENAVITAATRSWSCNDAPDAYVPTNLSCGNRSGAFPADAGRSGPYARLDAMYQSETTAAVVLATELLYQNGYSHAWGFKGALAAIARFDASHGAWNRGSVQDHWPWLINRRLGTSYPTVPARYGRSLGYTDWLYGRRSGGGGRGPGATPRPTQPVPVTRPKHTSPPVAQTVAPPAADPTPTSLPSAGAVAPSGSPTSDPDLEAGGVASTPGSATGSPIRQLVAGGVLAVLILWATATIIRTRARQSPVRGRPRALGRPG
jgi:hypothetical protein